MPPVLPSAGLEVFFGPKIPRRNSNTDKNNNKEEEEDEEEERLLLKQNTLSIQLLEV